MTYLNIYKLTLKFFSKKYYTILSKKNQKKITYSNQNKSIIKKK